MIPHFSLAKKNLNWEWGSLLTIGGTDSTLRATQMQLRRCLAEGPGTVAEPALNLQRLDDQHHFLLRKLHSLSGIVPIGAFLFEHLLTNSRAFGWFGLFNGGPEAFNEDVLWIHNLPYLLVMEIGLIFLPLAFHALYGIKIARSAERNVASYPYMANKRYGLQRLTGYVAFGFLIIHLMKFRFAHLVGLTEHSFLDPALPDKFALTQQGLMHWNLWGIAVPAWFTLTIYVIGLAAAVYHFANGIWSFCVSWGITVGEKAQKAVGMFATAVGLVLFLWGSVSLYAFATTDHVSGNPPTVTGNSEIASSDEDAESGVRDAD